MAINLQQFLAKQLSDGVIDQQLCDLLNAVADLSKEINDKVTHGALAGVLGFAGTDNVQGEHQKKLDVITNEIFVEGVEWTGCLSRHGPVKKWTTACLLRQLTNAANISSCSTP